VEAAQKEKKKGLKLARSNSFSRMSKLVTKGDKVGEKGRWVYSFRLKGGFKQTAAITHWALERKRHVGEEG